MSRKRRSLLDTTNSHGGAPDRDVEPTDEIQRPTPTAGGRAEMPTEPIQRPPIRAAAASTPDPAEGSLLSPLVRDRMSEGGEWFLATGQPPPDRPGASDSGFEPPVKNAAPTNTWLWFAGIAGIGVVAALFLGALLVAWTVL